MEDLFNTFFLSVAESLIDFLIRVSIKGMAFCYALEPNNLLFFY